MGWWERGINNFFVSEDGVSSGLDTIGLGGGLYKKTQGVIGYGKMNFCCYLSGSEGSRTMAQRLGGVKAEKYK